MRHALALLLSFALLAGPASAATITIVNADGAGEGFNDPTPATPVGGNSGTTIGEQRLIAFQFAADVWGSILPSDVGIRVVASFDPLDCDAGGGVLGSAGPIQVFDNFPNAPETNTWYVVAEANKLAGFDLAPASQPSPDDLRARFNVDIDDNPDCIASSDWYYGLDGNDGGDIDLVVVLLHEFAHGLGFLSLVTQSTGQLFGGQIDIYSKFLFDNDLGLHWPDMTDGQRASSVINPQSVAFDGPNLNHEGPLYLGDLPVLEATAPASVAGTYSIGEAAFGPQVGDPVVTGAVVLAEDGTAPVNDVCEPISNGGALAGNVAIVDRGACSFVSKVQACQDAGAIGVVVVNNVSGAPITMGGSSSTITIPSVMVSDVDGAALKAELGNGLTVSFTTDPSQKAGTDAAGRVLIYTPDPRQPGSSVSHFDVSASPNLLMEPAINSGLDPTSVDLTRPLFQDIGWFYPEVTDAPGTPARTALTGNHPNPFNPRTTISFDVARDGAATLRVFDIKGRHLRTLHDGPITAGHHELEWDGRTDSGQAVASGVYFYKLEADGWSGLQRMVLLK